MNTNRRKSAEKTTAPCLLKRATRLFVGLLTLLAGISGWAATTNFTTAGTFSWTVPDGVTSVTVECWGGGGAGGSVTNAGGTTGSSSTAGGGGAGGAYVMKTNIAVTPGNNYTVTVGSGGTPVVLSPAEGVRSDGGDSWFMDTSTVLAKGGGGGMSKNAPRPASGSGGTNLLGSIGDIINMGGLGADGNGAVGVQASGGGGGSGGTLGAGNNGGSPSIQSGATAVSGGGPGGNGKQGNTGAGSAPSSGFSGGGGGGIASANNGTALGGAGAAGKVAITYAIPAPTYTWVATTGSNDWTSPASWSPSRISPANNDVLIFNQGGSSTATNVSTQAIGKLQVSGNTSVTLRPAGGPNILTVSEPAADALTVDSSSQLNISGTTGLTNLTVNVAAGASGSISGSMLVADNNAANDSFTLTAADPAGITFNSGATFTQDCAGNIFGSGTANSVVFAPGATFVQISGANPFQKTAPSSVVVFQPGSLFSVRGNFQPNASGRTYAGLEINYATFSQNLNSGSAPLTVSNLSVLQGALSISMTGGFNLLGNAVVAAGASLTLNNNVTNASGKTITVNGRLGGTATNYGPAAVIVSPTGTLAPGASASSIGTMTFAAPPTLNGTNYLKIDRNGGASLADKIILSSGTLTYGGTLIVTNVGAALQPGDTFTNFVASAFNGWFSNIQLPPGYNWNTNQLLVNGTISIPGSTTPAISGVSVADGNILLAATNGTPGSPVAVLTSTNLALAIAQWAVATNGSFDGSGNFSCTVSNSFNSLTPQQFYLLQTP